MKSLILAFSLILFSSSYAQEYFSEHGREIIPVGDIEGVYSHWKTLQDRGIIKWNNDSHSWEITNRKYILFFLGDYMRRGPYGGRSVKWILDLKRNYGDQVDILIGNHDVNPLSFLVIWPSLEMGKIKSYNDWLKDKNLNNDLTSQIDWWAEQFGLQDKILNWWIEIAATRNGSDPNVGDLLAKIKNSDGKVDQAKLAVIFPKVEAYSSFLKFIAPGGANWNLLKTANLLKVFSGKRRFLFLHSGQPTAGNLGVVPGLNQRVYSQDGSENWPLTWERELEDWKKGQLNYMENLLSQYANPNTSPEDKVKISENLLKIRLPAYGDAGWDPIANKINTDANSVVYPDKPLNRYNSLPGIPDQNTIDILALGLVNYVVGGHSPVGDSATWRLGFSQKMNQLLFFTLMDTSYSPVEGTDQISLFEDGTIRLVAKTRNNLKFAVDYPSEGIINDWLKSGNKDLVFKANQIKKLGMIANGYLILGFVLKQDEHGIPSLDYSQFVLLKQDGYKFEYLVADQWGLEAAEKEGGGLKYATADLSKLFEEAYKQKIQLLEKHKKRFVKNEVLARFLNDKKIYVSSGPALNSYQPILSYEEGRAAVENYLNDWRVFLLNIPLNEEWVFVGGGTHGLEEDKNRIVNEVSQIREKNGGKKFELFGAITGVTGGSEFDANVKNYIVTKAYYWEDYFQKLMDVVFQAKNAKIYIEFAGGGGIVTKQIKEAIGYKITGENLEIILSKGLSPNGKSSATDAAIENLFKNQAAEPQATVVQPGKNGFKIIYGNTHILENSLTALSVPRNQLRSCQALF